jgi:aminoglycoside 3-N-acetyltransferase
MNKIRLFRELREHLDIEAGDILGVHSSLSSIGHVTGGPNTLIEALIASVGGKENGTLIMPCFNEPCDVVDLRSAPCRLGAVPEAFRLYPGVIRSVHHTHSVCAVGHLARDLTEGHENTTPLGKGSPFHKLSISGGDILLIGCDMRSCSIIHTAESLTNMPYLTIPYTGYDKSIRLLIDDLHKKVCPPVEVPGDSIAFTRVQHEMDKRGLLLHGKLGRADCIKARGRDILDTAIEMLNADPLVLLSDGPVSTARRRFMSSED